MKAILGSLWFSPVLAALLWIVITLSTGGSVAFALIGGVIVGAIAFVIGYAFHRYYDRRRRTAV
jgi:hypothetical protein